MAFSASTQQSEPVKKTEDVFKCMTCYVMFHEKVHLLQHYKSDYHRYNLKRRSCSNKAPISFEKFQELVQTTVAKDTKERYNKEYKTLYYCKLCGNKRFKSKQQYEQHCNTKKHLNNLKSQTQTRRVKSITENEEVDEMMKHTSVNEEEEDEDDTEMLPEYKDQDMVETVTVKKSDSSSSTASSPSENQQILASRLREGTVDTLCPFDLQPVDGLYGNLKYMYTKFGFNIPHVEHVVDLHGLMNYIFEKITVGQMCIYCDQGFGSVLATIHHMQSKNHHRLPIDRDYGEGMEEYADFYEDWEASSEKWCRTEMIIGKDGELVLPSGTRLGHRDLRTEFNKRERPQEHRAITANRVEEENRLLQKYGYPAITNGSNSESLVTHESYRTGGSGGKLVAAGVARWRTKEEKDIERKRGQNHQNTLKQDLDKGMKTNVSNRLRFRKQYMNAG